MPGPVQERDMKRICYLDDFSVVCISMAVESGGVGMPLGSGMAGRCPSRRMPPVSIAVAAVLVGTTVVGTVVAADTGTDDVAGRSRSMLSTTCCSSDEMYARHVYAHCELQVG